MSTTALPENAMTRALAACVHGTVPALMWGEPGVGKTARLEQLAVSWGRHLETIAASNRDAVDFMGLPMEEGGRVVYSPLSWALNLNNSASGLLFVDEFTTAGSAQKALLRVVNERIVGEQYLGDHVSIIAAANPPEVAVDGMDLAAPTANRFIHLDWQFDRDLWLNNVGTSFEHVQTPHPSTYLSDGGAARRAEVVQMVTGFLRHRPDLISKAPESIEEQGGAWPSPRSWTNVIDALTWLRTDDEDARDLILKGGVGEAVAREFLVWLASNDLHNPMDVLRDPSIVDWKGLRPDRAFALLSGVQVIVAGEPENKKLWERGIAVAIAAATSGRPDTAIPFARTVLSSPHARDGVPAQFRDSFSDLFTTMGRWRDAA